MVAAQVLPPVWMIFTARGEPVRNDAAVSIGCLLSLVPILAIAALIVTTPPDAVRLPPRRSVYLLAVATAWLVAWHVALLEPTATALLAGFAFPLGAGVFAAACVRLRVTPWWAAVAFWHPGFVGPLALLVVVSGPLSLAGAVALSIFAALRRRD